MATPSVRPSQYDGTQFVVELGLPMDRAVTKADAHQHVYGVRLDDGAKPWPYYRDAETGEWWSLSTPGPTRLDALAWMIDLDQLAYKTPRDAERYLTGVLDELADRAAALGGRAIPECSVADALAKMARVSDMLKVRDYRVTILVGSADGRPIPVRDWWLALEDAGLERGDGDLFWRFNEDFDEDGTEPYELYCAEPFSQPGYFHRGDLGGRVGFPDVAFHFRLRDIPAPEPVFHEMVTTARQVAESVRGRLLAPDGVPFDESTTLSALREASRQLNTLRDSA